MKLLGIALLSSLVVGDVAAELPPLIPRAVLFDNPARTAPRISPDGEWLAFLAPSASGVSNVWMEPLDGGDAFMVTDDQSRGIYGFTWAWDGEHLLYTQDRDGDENWHLYATRPGTRPGEAHTRDLTPFEGVAADQMFLDRALPHTVVVALNRRDPSVFDLHRIDLRTGAIELEAENPGDVAEWEVDHGLRARAMVALDPLTSDTILRVRDEGAEASWRELARWPFLETGSVLYEKLLGFTADGEGLFVQYPIGTDTTRLVVLDVRTGAVVEEIAWDPRVDLWNFWWKPQVLFDPSGSRVQAVGFADTRPEWRVIDPEVAVDFERLHRFDDGTLSIVSRDRDDRRWVVAFFSDRRAGRFHLYDRQTGSVRLLFEELPQLDAYATAPMLPLKISARDGRILPCLLTLPVGIVPRGQPMVLVPHGGPWAEDQWGYDPWVQLLANRGYAVLQVNFRGSTGRGKAHLNAGNGQWAAAMLDDLTDAVRWAIEVGIADPARVGIMGGSYGGYATYCGVTFTPDLYACAVAAVGPSNVRTLFASFPPYWGVRKKRWELRVGPVETDDAFNERISPLFHASAIRAPMLVGHGSHDPRVAQSESEAMVAAARANGADVTFVIYPDEGHGWARPENVKDWMGRVEEFLASHLGGRAQPFEEMEGTSAQLH